MKKLLLALLILLFSLPAYAGDCTNKFSWLPSTDNITVGYKILYGHTLGEYTEESDQGFPDPVDGRILGEVTNLTCDEPYHFVVIAYTINGIRSKYSNRVSVNYPPDMPDAPLNFRVESPTIINIIVN